MWIEPPVDLSALPEEPGVYRMLNARREVLYVGKARNLRKRVASYFQRRPDSPRIAAMVQQVAAIECTITRSEAEALVLEHNLIKQLKPRYNVMLKDAKSYPYIRFSRDPYPRIALYRGDKSEPGDYFGPFPHVRAVHETIKQLQIAFGLRDCENTVFRLRTRPCLKHQIGRCTAPCVGRISEADYAERVKAAQRFLRGEDETLLARWEAEMQEAAARLAFERAAVLRDRIRALRAILETADDRALPADADAFAVLRTGADAHVAVGMRRGRRDLGSYTLRAKRAAEASDLEILEQLFVDRYRREPPPARIFVDTDAATARALQEVTELLAGGKSKVRVRRALRGEARAWLARVRRSAEAVLAGRREQDLAPALADLAEMLGLAAPPALVAAVDNAHLGGKWMSAALTWIGEDGPVKELYRHYRLDKTRFTPGDDYAGMRELLTRIFRAIHEGELPKPDLLCVDGGRGQLAVAVEEARKAALDLPIVAAAKGPKRKAGEETLWAPWLAEPIRPGPRPGMLLLARVRDEAHRFAGRYLRKQATKSTFSSPLEAIPGLGPKRRAALLRRFGGLEGVRRASREQLAETPGISEALAARIFEALHRG